MAEKASIIGLFVIGGMTMLITGEPGIKVHGFPLGLVILGLGVLGWAPFYGLSLLRNVIAFVENNTRAAMVLVLLLVAAAIIKSSSVPGL